MNVAICDDNIQTLGQLENIVCECFSRNRNNFMCGTFSSGEELLCDLEENRYQIYILDIEMKGIGGLEVAAHIRQSDYNAIIIFATSHKELMQEAFEVVAFHYLLKPIDEEKAKQVILRAIKYLNLKKTVFQFKKGKRIHTLFYDEIIYFESSKRMIKVYVQGDVYEYYSTIKELMQKIDVQLFAQVNQSFVVNMEYVMTLDGEYVVLKTGKKITITKKYYGDFNAAYRRFILMRMR